MKTMKKRGLFSIAATVASLLAGTVSAVPASATTQNVNVVGYSIVSTAYTALEKAFQKTAAGKGVTFTNSFGASTTQAQNVIAGQGADVVNFSTGTDLQLLVDAGLVSPTWATSYPTVAKAKGIVTDSVVVFVVRAGNPLNITSWNDLTAPGVQIVTPNPISSGSARWNLLAAYQSQILQKKTAKQARAYLDSLVGNVVSEPTSGSKALTAFLAGTGNVLLAYEADAQQAIDNGSNIQIVNPDQNLLIENPAALTTTGSSNPAAVAFYKFLFSPVGQAIWETANFRPASPALKESVVTDFYQPTKLATISKLGGWPAVITKYFGTSGIITQIENAHGYTA